MKIKKTVRIKNSISGLSEQKSISIKVRRRVSKYEVVILKIGFSKLNKAGTEMLANCTCTLLKGPKNIIIDTMTAWDGSFLISALARHDLTPEDIDWVVCTHGHSDHIGNNSLFLKAKHIVGTSISKREIYFLHDFNKNPEYVIHDGVKVLHTPGHTLSDVSLIVDKRKTTMGTVAIVGDLFENKDDISDDNIWLNAGSENPDLQRKNRKTIINLANIVIPGHGDLFAVTPEIKYCFT